MSDDSTGTRKTALVAEDEFFIAAALESMIQDAGWAVCGPFSSIKSTLEAAETNGVINIAFIDISLKDGKSFEAIRQLKSRGIPVVICSGYLEEAMPGDLKEMPILKKPYTDAMVIDLLKRI